MDWQLFVHSIRAACGERHRFMPPCPPERIDWLQSRWGTLPQTLRSMLSLFNGGELFIEALPMLTILGVSTDPPQPPLVWPNECCIDYWLKSCRQAGNSGWPMGRTSYGSLWVLDSLSVREWDSSHSVWSGDAQSHSEWAERIIDDGKRYLLEQ
jgi:hypothetical protein